MSSPHWRGSVSMAVLLTVGLVAASCRDSGHLLGQTHDAAVESGTGTGGTGDGSGGASGGAAGHTAGLGGIGSGGAGTGGAMGGGGAAGALAMADAGIDGGPDGGGSAMELCLASGGTVTGMTCCQSVGDFPGTCGLAIGGCSCALANSHTIQSCSCPPGRCFSTGVGCVATTGAGGTGGVGFSGPGGAGGTGAGGAGGSSATGGSCSALTTLDACDARATCHSIFFDPHDCRCSQLGCCATFSRCAEGGSAACTRTGISCTLVEPYCEGPYAVAYANGCFEGCVRMTACAP